MTMKIKAVLTIDTSGSMSGKKLEDAKQASLDFTRKLPKDGKVGIVSFNGGGGKVVVSPTSKTNRIDLALTKLSANGQTPLHAGLKLSYLKLKGAGLKDKVAKALSLKNKEKEEETSKKSIVLSTDGKANVGPGNKGIISLGKKIKRQGIKIITVAIGGDADFKLLQELASGKENFHKAEFSGELPGLYREIASGLVVKED